VAVAGADHWWPPPSLEQITRGRRLHCSCTIVAASPEQRDLHCATIFHQYLLLKQDVGTKFMGAGKRSDEEREKR
jgi:hypothetical protein